MKVNKETKHKIKVLIVALMAAAIAFSALAPVFATENSRNKGEELREEIEEVKEAIKELVEDFNALPAYTERLVRVERLPAGFTFRYELRERARGEAARYLQIVLNTDPETRVAESGVGSPGRETDYFGPATRQALIRFQRKYGIPATGILGLQTRTKINEILREGIVIKEEPKEEVEKIRERFAEVLQTFLRIRERAKESEKED